MADSLLITPKSEEITNPLQQEFNKIILQLEQFDKKLEKTRVLLDKKLEYTKSYLIPFQTKLGLQALEMNKCLFKYYNTWNLSKSKKELLCWFIMDQIQITLRNSFGIDEKEITNLNELYEQLHVEAYGSRSDEDTDDDEMEEMFFNEMKDFMEDQLKRDGIHVDLSGLNQNMSNEEMAAYLKGQSLNAKDFLNGKQQRSGNKKSKKIREKELLQSKMEELKNQNISTIFKKIAKVLHPDLEQDPVARAHKLELMKLLTAAYEKKDLRTMLKLEMEWVLGEKEKLDQLTDEKLIVFIELLKEQLKELKSTILNISNEKIYSAMYAFSEFHTDLTKWNPVNKLKKMQYQYDQNSRSLAVIKVDNRLCRDTVMAWLQVYKQNDFIA